MTISTADPREADSVLTEASDDNVVVPDRPERSNSESAAEPAENEVPESTGGKPDQMSYEYTEEVPALLGKVAVHGDEEPEVVLNRDAVKEPPALVNSVKAAEGCQEASAELQGLRDALQDSLITAKYISAKIDAVSNDTDCLIKQVNSLSNRYELLAAGMESGSPGSNSKSILSKAFLTISASIVALLMAFQVYMSASMIKTERKQAEAVSLVMGNISTLNKKIAYHNSNIAKALTNPAQQEHARPTLPATESSGHEVHLTKEVAPANNSPVLERLNRLRNGLPEKKLIRKETGDWFAYNKKSEECISDVEVVEALNQAYKKIGRTLTPPVPMPAHNALCILKPDGKGGTEIVMTKAFLP